MMEDTHTRLIKEEKDNAYDFTNAKSIKILQIFSRMTLDGDENGNEVERSCCFSEERTYFKQHFQYFSQS